MKLETPREVDVWEHGIDVGRRKAARELLAICANVCFDEALDRPCHCPAYYRVREWMREQGLEKRDGWRCPHCGDAQSGSEPPRTCFGCGTPTRENAEAAREILSDCPGTIDATAQRWIEQRFGLEDE